MLRYVSFLKNGSGFEDGGGHFGEVLEAGINVSDEVSRRSNHWFLCVFLFFLRFELLFFRGLVAFLSFALPAIHAKFLS